MSYRPTTATMQSEKDDDKYGTHRGANTGAHASIPTNLGGMPQHYLAAQAANIHEAPAHVSGLAGQGSVDAGMNAVVNQLGGLGINSTRIGSAGAVPAMMSSYVTAAPEGQLMYPPSFQTSLPPFGYPQAHESTNPTVHPAFLGPNGFPFYTPSPYGLVPYPPGRNNLLPEFPEFNPREVPGLENRRSSYSTNESTPATPFLAGSLAARGDQASRVAVFDRSTYTTPSPQQYLAGAPGAAQHPKGLLACTIPADRSLDELVKRDPAIPTAVPAVFTPRESMKTLEQSLVNNIDGNRNVYIRGLHPTTDDELLLKYAERFGKVETSKAIIDTTTGACKGFGFAKFYDVRDSETCIRGFFRLGYEVGFARESFNSRLKAEGDDDSTNLYISNLPRHFTEAELVTVFLGFTILSSKILRDNLGNSRGVGFARFESREVCDQVIDEFQGLKLGPDGMAMQIRYADTPSQKELKRVTAERRQFRTNEYNVGAYGTTMVGMGPTMYNQQQGAYRRSHVPSHLPRTRRGVNGGGHGEYAEPPNHLHHFYRCQLWNGYNHSY